MPRIIVALVMLVAGCGGGSISLDDYPGELHAAGCDFLERCGSVADRDACDDATTVFDVRIDASLAAAIAMGKVAFDGEAARACADGLAERSCDVTSESGRAGPEVCSRIMLGKLAEGAACAFSTECVSQTCQLPFCDDTVQCCVGACVGNEPPRFARLGESCELSQCDVRSYCDELAGQCAALKRSGAFCTSSRECDFGLDCDQSGQCTSLPTLGQSCTGACRDVGTTCSSTTRTCVKVGLLGASCRSSQDCSPLYACDSSGRCSAGLALGAACTSTQLCAGGAFCDVPLDAPTGMCALPKPDGLSCQRDEICQSHYCDRPTGLCAAEPVCL